MGLTAFIKKWGPEYAVMLSLATLAYDFAYKQDEPWTVGDMLFVLLVVIFVNWFVRDPALFTLPGSMK